MTNTSIEINARKALINIGKMLPFTFCFILLIAYAETLFACILSHYRTFGGYIIPNTPISFVVANLFEYDMLFVFVTLVISVAIRACKWNLYATMYLFTNLIEKSIFDFELDLYVIYFITLANIIISGFFTYEGIKILKNAK